ncbi:peptide ABC transporter substrate-binding protein [Calothrix sp. FACHB-1219]|uniref:peptide ABC transporter substrate-binding protein n=1 Tax=unclassified Calothrix TaxID=2619626 RepID=UPI001689D87A|nr:MULTISPECIES: peptide ABC transporter substrate-binding protein [unclassified Calothrix]MBD2204951.1 peptide ABC transporter substrate-binding protein [Calothrix sp. FACHB-168]MBD2216224.1 peptide ABC transporter substrate-binding protein [Calothrix sp. FACHB-1219]
MEKLTPEELIEARCWIKDCCWADLKADQVDELTSGEVLRGIRRHYDGGIIAFKNAIALNTNEMRSRE